jgi:GTP pyrophosphokinase
VSTPRANGYESLHTTVMSPQGRWVEVQIRSKRMDDIAEHGLAAHYKYKESNSETNKFDRWIAEIRELLDNPDSSALDFVNDFKLNLFNDEIYVFTPKGELRVLPTGSTILDFAYDIHTQIGNKCIGAKVNNRLVPLSYELQNGDQLEILTSNKQKPNDEWLRFVVSAKAKQRIKQALNEAHKIVAADGKEILERKFKQHNIRNTPENIRALEKHFHIDTTTNFYYKIAKGKIDLTQLREFNVVGGNIVVERKIRSKKIKGSDEDLLNEGINTDTDTIIIGEDFKGFDYTLAKCCSPIPGDSIFGFITISSGIKIHRFNCPNAVHLLSKLAYRCLKARWQSSALVERVAAIRIIGIDQLGLVNRLTEIISKQNNINMKSISFETNDGVFEGRIKVLVYDTAQLEQLTRKFEQVEGVKSVTRWDAAVDSEELS